MRGTAAGGASAATRVVGVALASLALACGEPASARAPFGSPLAASASPGPLDVEAACARACATLARCGPSAACATRCERDASPMRDGFAASFAACVEHEIASHGCGGGGRDFADSRASACWLAGVDLYAARAPDDALEPLVRASCARAAACGGASGDTCATSLRDDLASRPGTRALRALHPDVLDSMSTCLARAPCGDDGALDGCVERARALRARGARGNDARGVPSSSAGGVDRSDGGVR